jgi:hypothetical protein
MAQVPPSEYAGQAAPPPVPAGPPPLPAESRVLTPPTPAKPAPAKPAPAAKKDDDEIHEDFGMDRPLVSEEEWKSIDFGPIKEEPGVDLDLGKDDKK